jgi:hypothetical protein
MEEIEQGMDLTIVEEYDKILRENNSETLNDRC